MKAFSLALVSILLGASLVGCGGKDKPAVCGSVDTLKSSITDLKSIDITSSGAVSSLQSQLTTVKSDFDQVKTDAKSQFSTQIEAVDGAYSTLVSTADTAKSSPSAANLAALAAAATTMLTDLQTLVSDVQKTC